MLGPGRTGTGQKQSDGAGDANANGHAAAEPERVPGAAGGHAAVLLAQTPSPASEGEEELPARAGAGHLEQALTPGWMGSCFPGSGTDHAKSPALIKSEFESSTNL